MKKLTGLGVALLVASSAVSAATGVPAVPVLSDSPALIVLAAVMAGLAARYFRGRNNK